MIWNIQNLLDQAWVIREGLVALVQETQSTTSFDKTLATSNAPSRAIGANWSRGFACQRICHDFSRIHVVEPCWLRCYGWEHCSCSGHEGIDQVANGDISRRSSQDPGTEKYHPRCHQINMSNSTSWLSRESTSSNPATCIENMDAKRIPETID